MPLNNKKGFTLIELLVVIGILVVLMTTAVLVINPTELIKQSRDSSRISDLSTLKSAIGLYLLSNGSGSNLASSTYGTAGCYLSTISGNGTTTAKCGVFAGAGITTNVSTTQANYKKNNSQGWIPIDLNLLYGAGTPLASLPTDPLNNASYYYAYATNGTTFEIDTFLESSKYGSKAQTDGGDSSAAYEVGTSLSQ